MIAAMERLHDVFISIVASSRLQLECASSAWKYRFGKVEDVAGTVEAVRVDS